SIGREGLGGTTGLVDMHPLQPSRPITPHGQVDSHVDARMREHDGVEGVVPSHYPPRSSKPEST
ncbi:MAG: hypothetical protein ACR2O4_02390, partial [Hyphomicrobiaceae bacterium]